VKDADRKLVDGILQGDAGAFESLYRQHVRRVYNYALSKLGQAVEAEDVTQEVFEAILHGIGKFEGRSELMVWIYGITRNVIHNRIRRRGSARFAPLEQAEAQPGPESECPERQAQLRASMLRVKTVIDSLPAEQRRILELRHEARMPIRDIAVMLQRSEDAIKSSLYRTRKTLAERLPDELS
jgi:RNA polymerase sigma-70 factor (ECF subfamily)